jgi:hypothetical protein
MVTHADLLGVRESTGYRLQVIGYREEDGNDSLMPICNLTP